MLVPRNIHQHLELVGRGQVEEPPGRDVVNPDEIGPQVADLRKVPAGLLRRGERQREGAVGQAPNKEALRAEPEKFALHADPGRCRSRDCHAV